MKHQDVRRYVQECILTNGSIPAQVKMENIRDIGGQLQCLDEPPICHPAKGTTDNKCWPKAEEPSDSIRHIGFASLQQQMGDDEAADDDENIDGLARIKDTLSPAGEGYPRIDQYV